MVDGYMVSFDWVYFIHCLPRHEIPQMGSSHAQLTSTLARPQIRRLCIFLVLGCQATRSTTSKPGCGISFPKAQVKRQLQAQALSFHSRKYSANRGQSAFPVTNGILIFTPAALPGPLLVAMGSGASGPVAGECDYS